MWNYHIYVSILPILGGTIVFFFFFLGGGWVTLFFFDEDMFIILFFCRWNYDEFKGLLQPVSRWSSYACFWWFPILFGYGNLIILSLNRYLKDVGIPLYIYIYIYSISVHCFIFWRWLLSSEMDLIFNKLWWNTNIMLHLHESFDKLYIYIYH